MKNDKRQFERLLRLIDRVYEAALDEDQWSGIAPEIARTFASTSTTLQIHRNTSAQVLSMTENVAGGIDDYRAHYWQRDIWVQRALERIGPSRVGSSKDLVHDTEFQESEFYRDWCRHLDVFYVVGAVFPSGSGDTAVLGVHRGRSAGNYDEADKWSVAQFLPHLQRALRVRDQLGVASLQRHLSLHALERSDTAILLVTAAAAIVFANRQAEALMTDRAGIRSLKGRLMAVDPHDSERLAACIRAACSCAHGPLSEGIVMLQRDARHPLSMLVAPFRHSLPGSPTAAAIVFIRDSHKVVAAATALRALFRLTPAEARIAEAMVNGKAVEQIAMSSGATTQTVRKQVKSIFAKTGTHRQSDCVALILRTVATLSRP